MTPFQLTSFEVIPDNIRSSLEQLYKISQEHITARFKEFVPKIIAEQKKLSDFYLNIINAMTENETPESLAPIQESISTFHYNDVAPVITLSPASRKAIKTILEEFLREISSTGILSKALKSMCEGLLIEEEIKLSDIDNNPNDIRMLLFQIQNYLESLNKILEEAQKPFISVEQVAQSTTEVDISELRLFLQSKQTLSCPIGPITLFITNNEGEYFVSIFSPEGTKLHESFSDSGPVDYNCINEYSFIASEIAMALNQR